MIFSSALFVYVPTRNRIDTGVMFVLLVWLG